MSLRRFFGVFFGIVGAVLLAAVLYIAFGDLGRHKARIEALVTQSIGRPSPSMAPSSCGCFRSLTSVPNAFAWAMCRVARSRR